MPDSEQRANEKRIFPDLLKYVGDDSEKLNEPLTGFLGMQGRLATGELAVIGRSPNQWLNEGWTAEEMCDEKNHQAVLEKTLVESLLETDRPCPLLWVTDCWAGGRGNMGRTAFWRVVRSVMDNMGIADVLKSDWPSHLMWTNLYKIAPAKGWNPSVRLCDVQFEFCVQILREEFLWWKPKRALFLTGWGRAKHFLTRFQTAQWKDVEEKKFVEWVGTADFEPSHRVQIVVAKHPMGKPEGRLVAEIVGAFNLIEERVAQR
jgi:hypothetical protein